MNAKKIMVTSVAGLMLGGVPLATGAQVVSADTVSTATSEVNTPVSNSLVSSIDDYVVVKNNQYVLELSDNVKTQFTSDEIAQVENNIVKANENVDKNSLAIDTRTKTSESKPRMMSRAAYNKHVTTRSFWWGMRYYFTSNAAVNEFVWGLNNKAIGVGAFALVGGPLATAAGAISAGYFYKAANDLNYYNQTHSRNQIYMDVNWSFFYSFHILK